MFVQLNTVRHGERQAQPDGQPPRPSGPGLRHRRQGDRRRWPARASTWPPRPSGPTPRGACPSDQNGYVGYDLAKAKAEVAEYEQETGDVVAHRHAHGAAQHRRGHRPAGAQPPSGRKAGITTHIQTLDQSARITAVVTGNYEVDLHQQLRLPRSGQRVLLLVVHRRSSRRRRSASTSPTTAPPQIDKDLTTGRQSGYPNIRKQAYDDLVQAAQRRGHPHLAVLHAVHLRRPEEGAGPGHGRRARPHPVRELHAQDLVGSGLALPLTDRSTRTRARVDMEFHV